MKKRHRLQSFRKLIFAEKLLESIILQFFFGLIQGFRLWYFKLFGSTTPFKKKKNKHIKISRF